MSGKTARKVIKMPALPKLLDRKIYKTGQTRGADDDVIYQNRVGRSSTVLIPYSCWEPCAIPQDGSSKYENGYIVLLTPEDYFNDPDITKVLASKGLVVGTNALVFFETRDQWNKHNPDVLGWKAAKRRTKPLGGNFVARIPATTASENGSRIIKGFAETSKKGAGIRVYEYASSAIIAQCRLQLESLFWFCADSAKVAVHNGMSAEDAHIRKTVILEKCKEEALLEMEQLVNARVVNVKGKTICPLCLEELSGQGFFSRMEQAEGREVPDLTVTQLNLFHIAELRTGVLNHRPYNIGWGHHHCNVVVKDSGIIKTLEWMQTVLNRNIEECRFTIGQKSD